DSSTLSANTSATVLSLYLTSSTCGLKRCPSQASHGSTISAINCISILTSPSPWHTSQRPPSTLNENAAGFKPFAFAAGRLAYKARISRSEERRVGKECSSRGQKND